MQQASPELTAALAEGSRTEYHVTRLAAKNLASQVSEWTLDREFATDLPGAMRAFSGTASAQFTCDLVGTGGISAPALYGPWAPRITGDIVRPGQSVVQYWGLGREYLPAFRGTVRSRSAQSGTDLVRVTALDGAERLRQPATLPRPDGGLNPANSFAWLASPLWAVDELLRRSGINSCPPPRTDSILYASLHGGAGPSIGYLTELGGYWGTWTRGANAPFDIAADASSTEISATYTPERKPVNRRTDNLWLEMWINTAGGNISPKLATIETFWFTGTGGIPYYLTMEVNATAGTMTAYCGSSPNPTANTSVSWQVAPLVSFPGTFHIGWALTWEAGGQPVITPFVTDAERNMYPQPAKSPGLSGLAHAGNLHHVKLTLKGLRGETFQVSTRNSIPFGIFDITQYGQWDREAVLDAPLFPMRVLPQVSGSTWDVITGIAKATLGTAYFDSNGYFRWRNHTRWTGNPSSALTVTSARELGSLVITEEIDACRNSVRATWDNWARTIPTDLGGPDETVSNMAIAPGATLTRTFLVDDDMYDPRTPSTTEVKSLDCIVIRSGTATSAPAAYGAVEAKVTRSGGVVTLTMRNRSIDTVYYRGVSMVASRVVDNTGPVPASVRSESLPSQDAYGVQAYDHETAGWVQDRSSAMNLAGALRLAGTYPIPLLSSVEILADPRIELGDVVRVQDTTGATLNTRAWVVGIRLSGSEGRVTMVLTLRGIDHQGYPADTGLFPDPPTPYGDQAPTD